MITKVLSKISLLGTPSLQAVGASRGENNELCTSYLMHPLSIKKINLERFLKTVLALAWCAGIMYRRISPPN